MKQLKQKPYLTYALDADGKLIHVDSVSRGLTCKCFCPHCKSELVAKNGGNFKAHHFAHINGSDCVGAVESALHKMAKDILQEHKLIMLPPVMRNGIETQTAFDKVEVEVFYKEFSLRPDCVGYIEDNRFMWVEFKRTHEVDVKKAGKIISAKVDCVEIDLNLCELDPIKLRTYIESSIEGRKWIYNHDNPHTFQIPNKSSNIQCRNYNNGYDFELRIPRHIAIDEEKTIVNLYDINKIDTNKHSYFCIACGKEVYIDVDDWSKCSFLHIDENAPCEDDFYLHEAAKKVLCERFNTQQKFDIYIPQIHLCEERSQCPFFYENSCSCTIQTLYDLKTYGYNSCEIEYKFPNNQFSYDAVIKRDDDLKTAIVIVIDANTCHVEPENLKNRAIEITVRCEYDIFKLYKEPLCEEFANFYNFVNREAKNVSCEKISRKILKFILFSSGKYYLGEDSCISPRKRSAIYEMVISNGCENNNELKQYAVLHCHNLQKMLCLCEVCYYLRAVGFFGHNKICIRYKTKGTPKNPLAAMPIKCPYFKLDVNLEARLTKKFYDLKFVEIDHIDI